MGRMYLKGNGSTWGQGSDGQLGKGPEQGRKGWGSALGGPKMTSFRTWGRMTRKVGAGSPGGVWEVVQLRAEEDPEGGDAGKIRVTGR